MKFYEIMSIAKGWEHTNLDSIIILALLLWAF